MREKKIIDVMCLNQVINSYRLLSLIFLFGRRKFEGFTMLSISY
jgi:hypothetical protein